MDAQLHQMRIGPSLLRRIAEVDEFKGRWQALGKLAPERLTSLRKIATVESVASSTRIEGVTLSDEEVHTLLRGVAPRRLETRDEQEVAGYAAVMELVFESWRELALTEGHILQLHRVLLELSPADAPHRGAYKTRPNSIEAIGPDGRSLGVLSKTASPFETPQEMAELVASAAAALTAKEHHPIPVIAAFVLRFLAIHPFQDGNGRLSRALTTLLLLRAGYVYAPYASLERVVEDNKDSYYERLRRGQAAWDDGGPDLTAWLDFFVDCLVEQKNGLLRRLDRERKLEPTAPLSAAILALALERGRVTVRDVVASAGANRNTVKVHIKQLVAAGQLVQRGRGRGTWYERV